MSTRAPGEAVHRLVDMVVEEVSLVDRAANKHRFLIVKRNEAMEQTTEDTADLNAPAPERAERTEKADGEVLAAATAALEMLTSAVERLTEASDEESTDIVSELVTALSDAATQLAELAGLESENVEADAKPEADTEKAGTERSSALGEVRALLGQVSQLLQAAQTKRQRASDDEPEAAPVEDGAVAKSAAPDGGQIADVLKALRQLTEAVQAQGERLARVEKGVALPASRHIERPAPKASEEVGWPLDLNRPLDRDSVAKDVSFHD